MLFDWLVTGKVIPVNPTHSLRGTRHSVKKEKASVLSVEEMRILLDSIDNAIEALRGVTGQTTATEKGRPKSATKKRGMSTDGRQRQIEAMRKYWAAKKAGKGPATKARKKRRPWSAAARKRMAAAQRKRWAAVRAKQTPKR